MKELMKKLRCWFDSVELDDPLQELPDLKLSPRKSADFMSCVLRSLDATLQDEMFVPIKGRALVPSKFVVFLNPADDKSWQNNKRIALEENLSLMLFERAIELAGSSSLSITGIEVKFRLDKNLVPPMFQVVAFWEKEEYQEAKSKYAAIKTVAADVSENSLFNLIITKDGRFEKEIPLFRQFVLIGRGTKTSDVDVVLDDPEIRRIHACLSVTGSNRFRLTNYGINPINVKMKTVQTNETVSLVPTEPIQIGRFKLQITHHHYLQADLPGATRSDHPFITVSN